MKNNRPSKGSSKVSRKKEIKYPVPDWMDADLRPMAEKLTGLERYDLAARLEQQAERLRGQADQLREMQPPGIKHDTVIALWVRPAAKKALLAYFNAYRDKQHANFTMDQELQTGARWFIEAALPLIATISFEDEFRLRYRDAEGLSDSVYSEKLIADAFEKWKKRSGK